MIRSLSRGLEFDRNAIRKVCNCRAKISPMADIRIGTSAFTAAGWPRTFYPDSLPEREYLTYYATKFDTVEVDSTFYRAPALTTVKGWYSKTPPGFIFAAKGRIYP